MTPTGSEHYPTSTELSHYPRKGGAESGAPGGVERVVAAWPHLPPDVRRQVLDLVAVAALEGGVA